MNLAENLRKIRKENGLSQEELADKLNVSRQSVSKWESGGAYPEMDKVIQLCKIFNLNIDELLNQDIKEVNNIKQSKNNINSFINGFLEYATKTIDMFSSMTFKQKIKCILEQIIIFGILAIAITLISNVLMHVLNNLFSLLPGNITSVINRILNTIFLLFAIVLSTILFLHIFKTRYLDYYEVVDVNDNDVASDNLKDESNQNIPEKEDNKKIILEKKKEKIIIRDPDHASYRFISGLLRILLFICKMFVAFIGLFFCLSLSSLIVGLVLSFLFVKIGAMFFGVLLLLLALVTINIILLILTYNFLVSRRNKIPRFALLFLASIIMIGASIGLIIIGVSDFNIVNGYPDSYVKEETKTVEMTNDLFFENYYGNIEYVESNDKDVKIVLKHSKYYNIIMHENDEHIYFYREVSNVNSETIKDYINDINNKTLYDYASYQIVVYSSKENIQRLQDNRTLYFQKLEEDNEERYRKEQYIYELERKNEELNEELTNKDLEINELKDKINMYENDN